MSGGTLGGCAPSGPCCNTELYPMVVRVPFGRVLLRSAAFPSAFVCVGDASAFCCPFPPGGEVAVRGRLKDKFEHNFFELQDPALCALPNAVEPRR